MRVCGAEARGGGTRALGQARFPPRRRGHVRKDATEDRLGAMTRVTSRAAILATVSRVSTSLALASLGGCSLVEDFDRYSAEYREDASGAVPPDAPPEDGSVAPPDTLPPGDGPDVSDDTGAPSDSGAPDTSTPPVDTGGDACPDCVALHGPSSICVAGACTCPGTRCPSTGPTFRCVDLDDDPLHCGGCGNACPAAEHCSGGTCACMPGFTRCGAGCYDLEGDAEHCGSCTLRCSSSINKCRAAAPLSGYKCTLDEYGCPTGRSVCARADASDHCFRLDRDEKNCGACGKACASGELCVGGTCRAFLPALGCSSTSSCDCSWLAPGASACPALPGGASPICVASGTCPS